MAGQQARGHQGRGRQAGRSEGDDLDLEAPEADSAEQQAAVIDDDTDDDTDGATPVDDDDAILEADPADRAEQERVVGLDDDEYR